MERIVEDRMKASYGYPPHCNPNHTASPEKVHSYYTMPEFGLC